MSTNRITVEENLCSDSNNDELNEAPLELEDGTQSTVDVLKELNLGTSNDPRPVSASALFSTIKKDKYLNLAMKYKDVLAWTYKEMPVLSPKVAVHYFVVKHGVRLIKES